MKDIGRRLYQLRRAKRISRLELAERARLTWQAVTAMELGERFPSLAELQRLLIALGANFRDLMER